MGIRLFALVLCLLVFACVTAQNVIEPTVKDPTYYLRKQQVAQRARSYPVTKIESNQTTSFQKLSQDSSSCFISRDASYTALSRNDDGSSSVISLPFTYNLYGTNYSQIYINTNGNLTFTNSYSSYNSAGFPTTTPMVAAFWADIDTENPLSGQIYYKVFSTRLIVIWDGVGYYNNKVDKLNTFEIILTNGSDSTIGVGNNTAFYYKDMQWTTGGASGSSNGFGGTPATVGINKGNNLNYIQVGRFNLDSSVYDGPGNNNDGINYLDYKCFVFNVDSSQNIAPSVSGLPTTNPVTVNVGDTVKLVPQFIGPEVGQTVTTTVNIHNACRTTYTVTNGTVSQVNLQFIADTCNVGKDTLTFTATDNGSPVRSTVINYYINVNKLNQTITFPSLPNITYGNPPITLPATASSGLPITYTVTSGPATVSGNVLTITGVGTVAVTASQPGNNVFNATTSVSRSFCVRSGMPGNISGDTVVCINTQKSYSVSTVAGATFIWTISGGGTLTPSGNTANVQWNTVGTHTLSVKYNSSCATGDSVRTLSIRVDNELSGTFANLQPANNATGIMLPLTFSWPAINNALAYDLYIWPSSSTKPSTPMVADIAQLSYAISDSNLLHYNMPYKWQVVAKRNCYTLLSAMQTFTLQYSPDLIVTNVGVPLTGFAGRSMRVSWNVKNTGRRLTTTGTWTDRVFVSANPVFSAGTALLQQDFLHSSSLAPDSSYTQTGDITLPSNISGPFYIHVFTDAANQLTEYNPGGENNNVGTSAPFNVQLKMPPDLLVSDLIIPLKASAGQKASIKWAVKNQGDTGVTTSPWLDKVYLSTSPLFNNSAILAGTYLHTGGLASNAEYSNSQLLTIPQVAAGNYYIFVVTDPEAAVTEWDETNNIRRSGTAISIGVPDLAVNSVSIPFAVNPGQKLRVTWTDKNVGNGAIENASWTDRIFLSPLPVYTPGNAIWFDVKFPPQTLDPGQELNRQIDLSVPDIVSGQYYAYVYADFPNTIYEDTSEYNNVSRSASVSNIATGLPVRDAGISEIITPKSDCGLAAAETVKVKITNYGNIAHTGFNVGYQVANNPAVIENVGSLALLPASTLQYSFSTKANLSATGAYTLKVFTQLPNDTTPSNDTLIIVIQHFPSLAAPSNLLPGNGAANLGKPVNFSWSAVPNAAKYDLYLWKSTDTIPSMPVAANLTQINYTYSGLLLAYGLSYNWKVVAKSDNCQTSSTVQSFSLRRLPDLVVDSTIVPTNGGTSETAFSLSWIVRNKGLGGTSSALWYDAVYISESAINRSGDSLLGTFTNLTALGPDTSYTHPLFTFLIPQGYQGRYYIVVKTDAYASVEETADTNNVRVIPINVTLAPPPDLQIDTLVVSPATLFSEDTLQIRWVVKNHGTGPTTTSLWMDKVYLSKNRTLNVGNATLLYSYYRTGALAVGESYAKSIQAKLPAHIGGTYYIHIVTDAGNNVFEYVKEDNNTALWDSLNVIMRPAPNLVINSVSVANDTVSNNQSIPLQWITRNEGAAAAAPVWLDDVRLTADTANGYSNYISLSYFRQINVLPSLSATGSQNMMLLPRNLTEGKYFFYAVSDIFNSVFEAGGETDNVSPYSAPVYVVNPDLRPLSLQAPASVRTEDTVTLSWTVQNTGKGSVIGSSWADAVYLSQDTVLGSDLLLVYSSVSGLMASGNQYTKQSSVVIPRGLSGRYYLILVTDAGNNVFEKAESNNQIRIPIDITITAWSDLTVTAIQLPATDTAGTGLNFSYTVRNGGARLSGKTWQDGFYLSPTKNGNDPNKIFLTSVGIQQTLDSNQTYTRTVSAALPSSISGPWFLQVKTDVFDDVYEHTAENNNSRASDTTVVISQLPNVDLTAISGNVIADSLTPGQTVTVEWYGGNTGNTTTIITSWNDAIYLSNNPVLDASDQSLKTVRVNKTLVTGQSYYQKATVTLPPDAGGRLYFLLNVDKDNEQNDTNRSNNTRVLSIILKDNGQVVDSGGSVVIVPPKPSDLVPISFAAAASGTSGQPFMLSYTVKNTKPGRTNTSDWTDRIYLSTDYVLDWSDIEIGSIPHTDALDSAAQYSNTLQALIPNNVSGNYVVLFKTDDDNRVFELNGENNNLAFSNIFIQPQQPCDLIVTQVTPLAGVQMAGQTITVNYTLKNVGNNPIQGVFSDAVYLSTDSAWDVHDVLLGTTGLLHNNIAPQAQANRQFSARLLNIAEGAYYVIVRTDILNNLLEVNEANNALSSVSPMTVNVKLLTMEVPAADTLAKGQLLYYRINIPAALKGETMLLTLKGDSVKRAVNRLYLKHTQAPAVNAYDFVSEIPFSANQEIIVPELKEGVYYILATGDDTAKSLQPVMLLAHIVPFEVTRIDAAKGGNTGAVTLKINGAKFDSATAFKLTGASGSISPVKVYYNNSTQVFATFNLLNANLGLYNVVATKAANDSARLVNGFEVVKGTGSTSGDGSGGGPGSGGGFVCQITNIGFEDGLGMSIYHPGSTRPNRYVAITIYYENKGNVDIPTPTRFFVSLKDSVPVAFAPDLLVEKKTELALDFTEAGGPPGILRPGASGYIKVYSIAYDIRIGSIDFMIVE